MITQPNVIIFGLDIFILTVTLAGFIYTLWNIKRKKFNLIPTMRLRIAGNVFYLLLSACFSFYS